MTTEREFTEKQMSVGKEEFERRLAGLREYAYSDAHPILTRSIVWEVAYVDSLFDELVAVRAALDAALVRVAKLETDKIPELSRWLTETEAELVAVRAALDALRTALKKEYERHGRATTLGGKEIRFCACCDHKPFPCVAREEIRMVLAAGSVPTPQGEPRDDA